MRNVTILLAVAAVLAMAVPAQGTLKYWKADVTGDWNYNGGGGATDTYWIDYGTGLPCTVPTDTDPDHVYLGLNNTTGIVTISAQGYFGRMRMGVSGVGHLVMTAGAKFDAEDIDVGYNANSVASTLTQQAGYVKMYDQLSVGCSSHQGTGGYGTYTISGGFISAGTGLYVGLATTTGTGRFEIVKTWTGDDPDTGITVDGYINVASYYQNTNSTLAITLDDSGDVTVIDVTGDATLAGTLEVNLGNYTGTDTIDVLQAGTLSYTGLSLDAASIAAGLSLTDDGNGMLQVTIPEPATMCLLAVGGIGALIRRRRK